MTKQLFLVIALTLGLTGCDRLAKLANQAELNARAIGAACRLSGRSLEDCFQRNERVSKADIYSGWREMNEYMSKNRIDVVPPPPDKAPARKGVASVEIGGGGDETTAADKAADAGKPADGAATDANKPATSEKPST